jgi:CheY-like chemotaxis protein
VDGVTPFFGDTVKTFTVNDVTEAGCAGSGSSGEEESMAGKKTILVVDDDRDLVASTRAYLEARGYRVTVAHSGAEARAVLQHELPDLFVLDIMMDYDTDGFALAHEIKDDPRTRPIPVIIVSGFTRELDEKTHIFEPMMYRDWPAAKFFEKPVKLSKLAEAIAGLLAGQPGAAQGPETATA